MNTSLATGAGLIAYERQRQVDKGYTVEHDATHGSHELVRAAACYLDGATDWPWDDDSYHPTPGDRVSELIRAGALLAAAIDVELAEARKMTGGG
jgi:hypothetical protein